MTQQFSMMAERAMSALREREAAHTKRMEDPAYRAEVEARQEREKATQRREERDRELARLADRGIPAKDVERLLDGLKETVAVGHAEQFLADEDAGMLVLSGRRGCGKTVAAGLCVFRGPPERRREREAREARVREGVSSIGPRFGSARFIDVSRLARLSRYQDDEIGPLERVALLAIDDLGMEYADSKGSFLATLDGLINARYAADLRTVITTNLNSKEFKLRYGERIADRIRETGRFVELNEESLRGRDV